MLKLPDATIECAKCKKHTLHCVKMTERTDAAVTISAVCSECGETIVKNLLGKPGRSSLGSAIKDRVAYAAHMRKVIDGDS